MENVQIDTSAEMVIHLHYFSADIPTFQPSSISVHFFSITHGTPRERDDQEKAFKPWAMDGIREELKLGTTFQVPAEISRFRPTKNNTFDNLSSSSITGP